MTTQTQIVTKTYTAESTFDFYVQVVKDLGISLNEIVQSVVVEEGYDSPYQFGSKMRRALGDGAYQILNINGVYVAWNDDTRTVAFRDSLTIPSKNRASIPTA